LGEGENEADEKEFWEIGGNFEIGTANPLITIPKPKQGIDWRILIYWEEMWQIFRNHAF
jgi:hypothetical protein